MYLVFNSGGTNTRVGISRDGESVKTVTSFETEKDWAKQATRLEEEAKKLLGDKRPGKVGGGIAGVWAPDKSKLLRSPNLPEWEGEAIKKRLEKMFSAPVVLGNDAEMEGLGEAMLGAGRRKRIVAYMTIGTGIGGAKIEDGKICARTFGFEPGHQILDVNDEVGYLEDFAGGAGMKRIYGKSPEEITDPEIWERETELVAMGVHNAIVFWSPEIVVLGGSLMHKIKLSRLKSKLELQMKRLPKLPEVVAGELKEKAGLYGALVSLG